MLQAGRSIQFNSKTLIIPHGAVLLRSWWARKKIHKILLTVILSTCPSSTIPDPNELGHGGSCELGHGGS